MVVVALAGHGVCFEKTRDAYFCPQDANPTEEEADTMISLAALFKRLDDSGAGVKFLLVDACRNDPKAGRGRGADGDVAPKPPVGTVALYSCRDGERAYESDTYKHGVFFHHVLRALRGDDPTAVNAKGEVTWNRLVTAIDESVPHDVPKVIGGGAQQSPMKRGELSGPSPVLLTLAKAAGPAPAATDDERLREDWEAYTKAARTTGIQRYIKDRGPAGVERWNRAAERGSAKGLLLAGESLFFGAGTDAKKAAELYRKAAELYRKAADLGLPEAMCQLASLYTHNQGVSQDGKKAVELHRKAADLGHTPALTHLGYMYSQGWGVAKDEKKAVELFGRAIDLGDAGAMLGLGSMYEAGRGVAKDDKKAAELFRKAADLGLLWAIYDLGRMYAGGLGVAKDEKKAAELFDRAVDSGDEFLIAFLGSDFASGRAGVPKDEAKAVELYRKAAGLGYPLGMVYLGGMYAEGRGVAKDEKAALEWYRKASDLGDGYGTYRLGEMYAEGRGVARDEAKAVELYRKAAAAGDESAREALDQLGKK